MDQVDCVVVGAGVIGLAVARRLALAGSSVVVVERESSFGTHTSSRNSEVIHASLYYPPGSLKARLCMRGRQLIYEYCRAHHVAHRRCGKLIIATEAGLEPGLEKIAASAHAAGAEEVHPITAAMLRGMEPRVRATAALSSPMTGIVDSHGLMLAYLGEAQDAGAMVAYRTRFERAWPTAGGIDLEFADPDGGRIRLRTRVLVNCGGLFASEVADAIEGLAEPERPRTRYARGVYFTLAGRSPCRHLVYPLPEPGGLGTHLTLDLAGRARFGPDVEWIDAPEYLVDPERATCFHAAITRYLPDVRMEDLLPGYAGVRPKLGGPDEPAADFVIRGPADHGVAGLVNLFGIESPGLTASLAIAEHVEALLAATA